jgi:hypothetical protein
LEEDVAAVHIRLTDEDLAAVDAAAPAGVAAGERYPAAGMARVNL